MKEWACDNGRVYMVPEKTCLLCEHSCVFWDYTNGPYMVLCDADNDVSQGLSGKCQLFKINEKR